MGEERLQRHLAAILAADVVGYSRLMGRDEAGTLATLKMLRTEIFDPKTSQYGGRIFKTTGDGALAEFPSAVDAVLAAIDVQRALAARNAHVPEERQIELRIGISVGDVIVDGDDLYGNGVNVAARMESLASPGGICVSGNVHEQVRAAARFNFEDLGAQDVKNIDQPVRAYRIGVDAEKSQKAAAEERLPAFDRPALAVLPFVNMSGDPEQEYFADGTVEEIITALSHIRWLSVIARNSSFVYKGQSIDVKRVGRELGVRYVLEGSVRRAGNRVRITGQLIDASTGAHLWADRFDGAIDDIFDLQDELMGKVVAAIAPKLEQAEIERIKRKPTESLDAYDYYLRGMASIYQWTRESYDEAIRLFYRSIELDPNFASAYGMAAWCYVWRKVNGWVDDRDKETLEAERIARRAVELGADDAVALSGGGYALVFVAHDLENGAAFIERALALNPSLSWALYSSGWTKAFLGDPESAIEHLTNAMRLSPLDPLLFRAQNAIAFAHFLAGRYDEAVTWAEASLRQRPNNLAALRELAASSALAGQLSKAELAAANLCQLDPHARVSTLNEWIPLRRQDDLVRLQEGLRKAGLPE